MTISTNRNLVRDGAARALVVARPSLAASARPASPPSRRAGGGVQSDVAVAAQKTYVAPATSTSTTCSPRAATPGNLRLRPAVDAAHLDHSRVHALAGHRLRLRRRDQEDARRPDLGRRPSPGAVGDQGRLRRPLAVHQRDERPHRAHRPARLQDQADPRPGPQPARQPRLVVRHAEHGVRDDGDPLLGAGAAAPGGVDKYATDYNGIIAGVKIDPQVRRDVAGLADPDAAVRLRPGRRRQAASDGWMFFTCYNSERATGKLEVKASQRDRDYIAAVDWRAARRRSPRARAT